MQSEKANNRINEIVETALKNLNDLVDVNTVIGKSIETSPNEFIIPVSKVTLGVLAGGGEYGKISIFKKGSDLPYSAGNGAIVSVKPCAFLIKESNGYKLLSIDGEPYEKILEKASEFISEFKKK